jgi:hypothetical protein
MAPLRHLRAKLVFLAKALNFWRAFPLAVTVLPIPLGAF